MLSGNSEKTFSTACSQNKVAEIYKKGMIEVHLEGCISLGRLGRSAVYPGIAVADGKLVRRKGLYYL
jgi:hypothetical protein